MEKTWYPKEYKGYQIEDLIKKVESKKPLTENESTILTEICDNYSKKQKVNFEKLAKNKYIRCIEVCGFIGGNTDGNS